MSSVSGLSTFGRIGLPASAPSRLRPSVAGFDLADAAATARAGRAGAVLSPSGPAGISVNSAGLLALQNELEGVDGQARRRARALLNGLASLQHALLGGGDAAAVLASLRAELQALPVAADPGLRALLADISLRVEVELALWDSG